MATKWRIFLLGAKFELVTYLEPRVHQRVPQLDVPSLAYDGCYLHVLLYAVTCLLPGKINALPLLDRVLGRTRQHTARSQRESTHSWTGGTDFSFLDAGVDSVQQVGSVLVALGQFGQLLPDQLPLVVAHHPLKCRVHILRREEEKKERIIVTG